jgi:hypothetical protein
MVELMVELKDQQKVVKMAVQLVLLMVEEMVHRKVTQLVARRVLHLEMLGQELVYMKVQQTTLSKAHQWAVEKVDQSDMMMAEWMVLLKVVQKVVQMAHPLADWMVLLKVVQKVV